ncbi:hypothetical protein ANCCEY_05552 [Ancylostoma ceylanicum]|uniref:Reverse transcriptase domain-containing protein n=1 Tax=Ancylostoma ceylanicum TaxID=53326 RepID=A0A0D6LVY8_9BILA|nr:hypothetical protein ANCCEY_05552 [Ancylostoma ceylanicum]
MLGEAAEAGRSIRNTRRDLSNRKTKMIALRHPDGTISSSKRVMEKVFYDFYPKLFDSHVRHPRKDGCFEVQHVINNTRAHDALRLTFIDSRKALDSVETESVLEALGNQGVPIQYTRIFRELYSNLTIRIWSFYDDITIDDSTEVQQGDTVSPKVFTATAKDVMRKLKWDDMGVQVKDRLLHTLRFANDIVLMTPSISRAKRMVADFDDACGKVGLQLNLTKTMFMRNGWVPDVSFSLHGTTTSKCYSYVYLDREVNMMNDLAPELGRKKRAAWGAYKSIEDVVKRTKNTKLRAHFLTTTVLPALT